MTDALHTDILDRENIDGQYLRPPVLTILLETIEWENCDTVRRLLVKRQSNQSSQQPYFTTLTLFTYF